MDQDHPGPIFWGSNKKQDAFDQHFFVPGEGGCASPRIRSRASVIAPFLDDFRFFLAHVDHENTLGVPGVMRVRPFHACMVLAKWQRSLMIHPYIQIRIVIEYLMAAGTDPKPVSDTSENFIKKTGHFAAEFRKVVTHHRMAS